MKQRTDIIRSERMSAASHQMHINPDSVAKFYKSLRSCLPVFLSDMHLDAVRLRKATGLRRLLKYVSPGGIKPHPSFALRSGTAP